MENTYKKLIEENIKAHKKFIGLESIIDDLVNDVYEHAKTVLDNVEDENITLPYLNKVITTSLITVPKRLNINTRQSSKASNLIESIENKQNYIQQEEPVIIAVTNSDSVTTYENFVSNTDDFFEDETTEFFENEEVEESFSSVETEDKEEDFIPTQLEDTFQATQEDVIEEEEIVVEQSYQQEDIIEELDESTDIAPEVDKNLVDMMINGVPDDDGELEETVNDSFNDFNESDELQDNLALDNSENYDTEPVYETEEAVEASEDLDIIEELDVEANVEEPVVEEEEEEEGLFEDSVEILTLENDDVFDDEELIQDSNIDELEILEEVDNNVLLEETIIEENIAEEQILVVEDEIYEEVEAEVEEEVGSNIIESSDENSLLIQRFDCFSYEPDLEPDIDQEEIISGLKELSNKHPNLKIMEIFSLKFNKALTIDQVADKLDISLEQVEEAIIEIEDLVRD